MSCCTLHPYRSGLCKSCWRAQKELEYHCTWPNCLRPVFALTLCRGHFRQINVECAWPNCHRPSYCKQVCAHHYRKRQIPDKIECVECTRPVYMNHKCFYHFTSRKCIECSKPVFSKRLCRKHYMREYRRQRSAVSGPTINNETSPATVQTVPDTTIQRPASQSSLEHCVISNT